VSKKSETACELSSLNGTTWRACAVPAEDGSWKNIVIEQIVVAEADAPVRANGHARHASSQMRMLSRELADEFSNLLTGVLGHASLAAAELDGNTSRDIVAIERTAREAAQLVRKLSALGGQGRHSQETDLNPLVKQYVKKIQPGYFADRPQLVSCDDGCRVTAEANSLKMVLDSISAHAKENLREDGQVCFTLSHSDTHACLSLSFEGDASFPAGWSDGMPPAVGQAGWDLIFAREVVRGMGGELELSGDAGRAMLLATLPLAGVTA
jgi:hypothetical protein